MQRKKKKNPTAHLRAGKYYKLFPKRNLRSHKTNQNEVATFIRSPINNRTFCLEYESYQTE